LIIGLTGQIGSGKSSVAKVFARLGATVIDADRIGREVVERSSPLRRKLAQTFGSSVIDARGNIRRKKLAALAFVDRVSRDKLNSLVHPYLLAELRKQVRRADSKGRVVVVDAALLLHWKMDREVDIVVVVQASRKMRLARLQARGVERKDALAREKAQLPYAEFRRRADHIILNNGRPDDLAQESRLLFARLTAQTD
jgi:dephospho-CoA kinase